ncbi:MAG: hypothetical protein A3C07_04845 [Candidatus Sungbacteria bacterium RIFCSPHIGHO2_02_FULL_47_11]|uniref:Uncharacterized protein n=1 Tax=Candidatus Sungbacteria bacterium RIFCSPHIGHO2_02_FULL_47_11 TaxID=1802270 RepID=A0A1G2KM57_9BACT|nr:MAG: hypothetical protein A3C07_04845 [Candidatus Sungbacteria bacterium RIFCSPHIGHO2_02_FULL_47_11]
MQLSVGGAEGTATGHVYLTGGLGVGIATTTAGGLQLTGNTLFGDAAADLVMFNSASLRYNNAGTSTIPSSNANAWSYATSSANIPLVKFDTSNTRVGIGTTSPSETFAVDGTAVFTGNVSVGGTFTPTQTAATVFLVGGGYGDTGVTIAGDGTIQTNASTTMDGALTVSGNVTLGNAAADSLTLNAATGTIAASSASSWAIATSSANIPFLRFDTSNYRIGLSTTSPATTFSIGGAGHLYLLGGIGVGTATTTAGAIENIGNSLFGDAAGDLVMYNSAALVFNNAGTSTIPSANANAWSYATSSANIPLVKFDTSNTRVGISTTSPLATLSVGGTGYFTGTLGVGTSSPATTFSVIGNDYITGGLGVGVATTTAGAIENIGNSLFGDAAGDLVMFNSASLRYNNAGTSTIPSSNANAWSYATSSAGIPVVKLDTSNTRVGISTSTPGATLAVGGDGTAIIMGGATSTLSLHSTGGTKGGCIEFESAEGDAVFKLYATSTGQPVFESGSCR